MRQESARHRPVGSTGATAKGGETERDLKRDSLTHGREGGWVGVRKEGVGGGTRSGIGGRAKSQQALGSKEGGLQTSPGETSRQRWRGFRPRGHHEARNKNGKEITLTDHKVLLCASTL